MKKITGAYIIICLSILLMLWNISSLDFNNLRNGSFSGIISNLLLILAMIISIRDLKKLKKEKN